MTTKSELTGNPGSSLVCPKCGIFYSARPGDYWALEPSDVIRCECGAALELFEHDLARPSKLEDVAEKARILLDDHTRHGSDCDCPTCALRAAVERLDGR